jgi:hypothetical protein
LARYLKKWCDHDPILVETKGGTMWVRPKYTIITSQYRMEEIWTDEQTLDALRRRYTFVHISVPHIAQQDNNYNAP